MHPYTRPQLWMLLALTTLAGLGVAAGNWRRAHPDLADRIERFDAEYVIDPSMPSLSVATPADETDSQAAAQMSATEEAVAPVSAPGSPVEQSAEIEPQGMKRVRVSPTRAAVGGEKDDALASVPLDLNRATAQDLERLPGIGPGLAKRIVKAREVAGRFESIDDLQRVPGLGRVKFGRLRDLVTVTD